MFIIFEILALFFIGWMSQGSLYLTIMNMVGLMYVFMVRRRWSCYPIAGLIFAFMYAYVMRQQMVFGEYYFNVIVTIPMLIWAIVSAILDIKGNLAIRKFNAKLLYILFPVVYCALYYFLPVVSMSKLIDVLSTTFALYATYFMVNRYSNAFIFWTLANLTNTALHLYLGNYAIASMFAIYLVNGIFGIIEWKKGEKINGNN